MSVEGCKDISTPLLMPLMPLHGKQSMMPTLMAYPSLMAIHGDTFGAMQQTIMNSIGGLLTSSARVLAQTLAIQDGMSLPLLELITTAKVGL